MALKTEFSAILNTKMDRKGFLRHVAIAAVAVTGLSALLRTLAPAAKPQTPAAARVSDGYGSSVYGGRKTS